MLLIYKFPNKIINNIKVMCHIIACLWNLLAIFEYKYLGKYKNWHTADGVKDATWYVQYSYSLYWATTTLMLKGVKKIVG
jgi:hypothetical protein